MVTNPDGQLFAFLQEDIRFFGPFNYHSKHLNGHGWVFEDGSIVVYYLSSNDTVIRERLRGKGYITQIIEIMQRHEYELIGKLIMQNIDF